MAQTAFEGAGTAANVTKTGQAWSNPTAAQGDTANSSWASRVGSLGASTDHLRGSAYGLALGSTAAVTGIEVRLPNSIIGNFGSAGDTWTVTAQIVGPAGTAIGTTKTVTIADSEGAVTKTLGSSTDMWGIASLSGADVNDTDFGVRIYAELTTANGSSAINIDALWIRLTYTPAAAGFSFGQVIG